jgi:hypothetical protein
MQWPARDAVRTTRSSGSRWRTPGSPTQVKQLSGRLKTDRPDVLWLARLTEKERRVAPRRQFAPHGTGSAPSRSRSRNIEATLSASPKPLNANYNGKYDTRCGLAIYSKLWRSRQVIWTPQLTRSAF